MLAGTAGVGEGIVEIPSVGIKAERLSDLSLFELAWVVKNGYRICIPTPASYVAQKLFINPTRRPERKRPQDIRKVSVLLQAMEGVPGQMESLEQLLGKLPADKSDRILEIAKGNSIALPWKPAGIRRRSRVFSVSAVPEVRRGMLVAPAGGGGGARFAG